MDIGMRWNPALHELRRLAVVEGSLGALKGPRLSLAFKQWPREWQALVCEMKWLLFASLERARSTHAHTHTLPKRAARDAARGPWWCERS